MLKEKDKLTKAQRITVIVTIGVVFLGIILQVLVNTWNSPDIRYECGAYYKLREQSVVSCKLKNFGHKTANSIRVSVKFKSDILDVQISPFTKYSILNGKIGDKELVIEVERIVPNSQVTIFYATQQSQEEPYIEKIEYEDNLAKTGKPVLWFIILAVSIYVFTGFLVAFFSERLQRKRLDSFYKNVDEVIKFAYKLKREQATEEELKEKFELNFKNVSFRRGTLRRIAKSIFKNIE